MYNNWFESLVWTLHHHFVSFYQIEYLNRTIGMMMNPFLKPMPSCFNKLAFM